MQGNEVHLNVHLAKQTYNTLGLILLCKFTVQVMKKAFDEGWGGVICKTMSLDSSKVGLNQGPEGFFGYQKFLYDQL